MTLTKFMARSTWVAHAFEWEKLLKCHLKGKTSKKLANGQNIDYSEKRKRPKGFICPCTGVKYHNIQTCLLVYAADSGERLQDHWSSGFNFSSEKISVYCMDNFVMKGAVSWENQQSAYAKTKAQISFAVTAKLISAFVFATRIVQFLFYLNPKFQASSFFLCL